MGDFKCAVALLFFWPQLLLRIVGAFIPSLYSQVLDHKREMSAPERSLFDRGVKHNFSLDDLGLVSGEKVSARVYEAWLAAQTFRFGDALSFDELQKANQLRLFSDLAKEQPLDQGHALKIDLRARPDLGRPSMKASLYGGIADAVNEGQRHFAERK